MIEVTIPNWGKFNARADRSNFSWFRFENTFFHDQAVFSLSDSARVLYIFLLCEASKKNKAEVTLKPEYIAAILGRSLECVHEDISKLNDLQLIAASCHQMVSSRRHDAVITPPTGGVTPSYIQTDRQTDIVAANACDRTQLLEGICKKYPRRKGGLNKAQAIKRLKHLSMTDLERFDRAVANYAAFCVAEKKAGTEFVMQLSTFASRWEEWADLTQPATKRIQTPEEFLREEEQRRAAEFARALTLNEKPQEEDTHGIA